MAATDVALEVVLHASEAAAPRFTPRELREIKEHLGRTFSQILSDEDTDDKFVVLAWLKLRRDGHDVDWDDMDDVIVSLVPDQPPDPTNGRPPATSPGSAATGDSPRDRLTS